ncbi:unnamed protein product [Lampetra fluviatilis]
MCGGGFLGDTVMTVVTAPLGGLRATADLGRLAGTRVEVAGLAGAVRLNPREAEAMGGRGSPSERAPKLNSLAGEHLEKNAALLPCEPLTRQYEYHNGRRLRLDHGFPQSIRISRGPA